MIVSAPTAMAAMPIHLKNIAFICSFPLLAELSFSPIGGHCIVSRDYCL